MVNGSTDQDVGVPLPGKPGCTSGPAGRYPANWAPQSQSPQKEKENPKKRKLPCREPELDDENEEDNNAFFWNNTESSFVQFISMNPLIDKGASLAKLTCFAVSDTLKKLKVDPVHVQRTASNVNIRVATAQESTRLLSAKTLAGVPVQSVPHKTLNYSKGVVKHREFIICSAAEMETIPNVTDAHHILRTVKGVPTPTGTWILTFKSPVCPKAIDVCYLKNIRVTPYIPKPMR